MFEVEYCNNPELGDIHSTDIKYDYTFDVEFNAKLKDLDKFLFLVDMHTIINSCGDDLLSITIDDFDEFWKINKQLLNFVNAILSSMHLAAFRLFSIKTAYKAPRLIASNPI